MIGLDTNALLRLLTEDDPAQAAQVRKRLAALDTVPESVLLNNVVLVETLWTLRRLYGFERAQLQDLLGKLLSASTFCFEDRATVINIAKQRCKNESDNGHVHHRGIAQQVTRRRAHH